MSNLIVYALASGSILAAAVLVLILFRKNEKAVKKTADIILKSRPVEPPIKKGDEPTLKSRPVEPPIKK